jgi:phosphoribosylformylglycinamidine synthase I
MSKIKPKALIFSGYGLNCEEDAKFAFEMAGGEADIVHINDLIENPKMLTKYQVLVLPGGFSYGDDTGSGKAYASRIKNHLSEEIENFFERDTLGIGICNGFQIITNVGLVPGALAHNEGARYVDRWVDLKVTGKSPWLSGIDTLSLPVAHGEGKYILDEKSLDKMESEGTVAFIYEKGAISRYQDLPANPNGSTRDIAGVLSHNGRILGMMPHPERAIFFTERPDWPLLKEIFIREGLLIPKEGAGLQIFKNGVQYFN